MCTRLSITLRCCCLELHLSAARRSPPAGLTLTHCPCHPLASVQCLFMDLLTLLRPAHLKLLMAARGGAPAAAEGGCAQQALYDEAVAALRLSPGQRRSMVAEWRAFQARQAELAGAVNAAAAGAAAAAELPPQSAADDEPQEAASPTTAAAAAAAAAAARAAAGAAAAAQEAEAGPASSLAAQAEQCMLLAQRAGALSAAAEAHWAALLAFHDTAWYMLTPLQGARLLVACRGLYPDPVQLALAVERLEAEAAGGEQTEPSGSEQAGSPWQSAGHADGSDSDAAAAADSWRQRAAEQLSGDCPQHSCELSTSLLRLTSGR